MDPIPVTIPPHDPTSRPPSAFRSLALSVAGTVVGMAVILAGMLMVVRLPDWWQGYAAATIAIVLAAVASLVPLAFGMRGGPNAMVQMFMASTAIRAVVALGLCALAVGIGRYPAVPTFAMVIPYYLALLAVETACLAKAARAARTRREL